MRWKAVIACGEIGDPRAVDPLLTLLCDEGHVVKSRTGRALGLIGEAAVDLLIRSLRDGDGSLLCHPLRPRLAGFRVAAVQEWKQPSGYSSQISDTYVRNGREYGDWQR